MDIQKEIISAIETLIDKKIKDTNFGDDIAARIVFVDEESNKYQVRINDKYYQVENATPDSYSVNEVVWIRNPGNFKNAFIIGRKTHINKPTLKTINETVTDSNEKVTVAVTTANNAKLASETVKTTAEDAVKTAENVKATADNANKTAETAKTTADNAVTTANDAKTTADTAKTTADNAKATADAVKTTADTASNTANTAKTIADNAKTTADNAYSLANSLNLTEMVYIGDSYADNVDGGTLADVISKILKLNLHNYAEGGAGYIRTGRYGKNFGQNIAKAGEELSENIRNHTKYVFFIGGLNDVNDDRDSAGNWVNNNDTTVLENAISAFNSAGTLFPNAEIIVGNPYVTFCNAAWYPANIKFSFIEGACFCCSAKTHYLKYLQNAMIGMNDFISEDNLHYLTEGQRRIAMNIVNMVNGGSVLQWPYNVAIAAGDNFLVSLTISRDLTGYYFHGYAKPKATVTTDNNTVCYFAKYVTFFEPRYIPITHGNAPATVIVNPGGGSYGDETFGSIVVFDNGITINKDDTLWFDFHINF